MPDVTIDTEISYCPHLQIYRYRRGDEEYFFDDDKLAATIDLELKSGQQREAEFMALLTGVARKYPHQVIKFDQDGQARIVEREKIPEGGGQAGGGGVDGG